MQMRQLPPQAHQLILKAQKFLNNAKVQLFQILVGASRLTLSTGNIAHLLVLRSLFPATRFTSPFSEQNLHRFRNDSSVIRATQNVISNLSDTLELGNAVRDLHATIHTTLYTPSYAPPFGDDPLAKQIANEIANIYFENLEITLEDVQKVLLSHHSSNPITPDLIRKIAHARVDRDRYELKMLLPSEDLLKVAVSNLKNPLDNKKQEIANIFDQYISWWKFSLFGHHHNDRAKAVKAAILNSNSLEEIRNILDRQQIIVSGTTYESSLPATNWINYRWNNHRHVKNISTKPESSGYYHVLEQAKTFIRN